MQRVSRLKREIEKLKKDPPTGITCFIKDDQFDLVEVLIVGPPNCPYENGIFKVEIQVPDNYPFEPPSLKFQTKVYHPNIDTEGRICMDLLKMPPSGNWKPSAGIEGILVALRMLLSYPNPEDPLMVDIAKELKNNPTEFEKHAREFTKEYA